jgi:DNA-binding ferritin-like protein
MSNQNVINGLNGILADSIVLYQKLHHYHWRVKGRGFYQLHGMFEAFYDEFAEVTDGVAERILMIGGAPLASLTQALELASVKEDVTVPDGQRMVVNLATDLESFRAKVRGVVEMADESGDRGTVNLKKLTTVAGAPVVDNQNAMTAGPRGPMLLQDVWFLEKLAHFDREVIPERRMHAKGSGAFGTFTVTHDITRYTKAKLFSAVGKKTEMFVRFSTVAGERGAADAERDIRGFAMKFYTEEGNWDLVGNNTPVFFLRDPLKFPDLNHAVKRDPRTNLRSAEEQLGLLDLAARGAAPGHHHHERPRHPASYRHMHGFGSHTFSFINAQRAVLGEVPPPLPAGHRNLTDAEAAALVGATARATSATCSTRSRRATSRAGHCSSRSCRRSGRGEGARTTPST